MNCDGSFFVAGALNRASQHTPDVSFFSCTTTVGCWLSPNVGIWSGKLDELLEPLPEQPLEVHRKAAGRIDLTSRSESLPFDIRSAET